MIRLKLISLLLLIANFATGQQIVVSGKTRPNQKNIRLAVFDPDLLNNINTLARCTADSNGNFQLHAAISAPTAAQLADVPVFITPGDSILMIQDTTTKQFIFYGPSSAHYNYFFEKKKLKLNYLLRWTDKPVDEYKSTLLADYQKELSFIDDYCRNHKVSSDFKYFLCTEARYGYLKNLLAPINKTNGENVKRPGFSTDYFNDVINEDFSDEKKLISRNYVWAAVAYMTYLCTDSSYYLSGTYLKSLYETSKQHLKGKVRDKVLLFIMERYASFNVVNYESTYIELYNDLKNILTNPTQKEYLNKLYEKYVKLNKPFKDEVKTSKLLDLEGKQLTWNDVLNKHRGKVIYVDFWASWCAPCKEELPFSKKISAQYDPEKVAFVYVSLDDDYTVPAWKDVIAKLNLNKAEQYVIADPQGSSQLAQYLNLLAIPRYILIDSNGLLVVGDAPRPSDDLKLHELLLKFYAD